MVRPGTESGMVKARILIAQIHNGQATNTLVSTRMAKGPDKAPTLLTTVTNTLVNSGTTSFMVKAPTLTPMAIDTLVSTRITKGLVKAYTFMAQIHNGQATNTLVD